MAPFSPPAAVRPNTAPASSTRSRRAGCGGTNPGPTSNSPTPAPSYSPDGSDGLEASLRRSDPAARRPPARHLEDAAGYIMKLPKAEQNLGEWQAAIECLILVAEKNGPTHDGAHRHDEGAMPGSPQGAARSPPPRRAAPPSPRGHGQVPNASMDARSMSTTITFRSDGAGLRSHWSPAATLLPASQRERATALTQIPRDQIPPTHPCCGPCAGYKPLVGVAG